MSKLSRNYHVAPEQSNRTLAAALRTWLPDRSWSDVQRLVRGRHVLVNGNLCLDTGRRLKTREVVKVLEHPAAPPPSELDVRIRYRDAQVVVVEKPAGVTSTRHSEEAAWPTRRKQIQPTLDEMLPRVLGKLERPKRAGGKGRPARGGPPRPGGLPQVRAVHRLDRETSGLMVFARTVQAERKLAEQFRAHSTQRVYWGVAMGRVEQLTIESRLVRDRGDGRRGSTDQPNLGKQAVTHVRPIEYLDGYTVIECRLETGRTHQIRIHLAEAGHPLCGERVYHQPLAGRPHQDRSGAPRIALHAAELGFEHPATGERLEFKMPWPRDLAEFLTRLRRQRPDARNDKSGED
jgi:23S rRNA pseudouridine1911/1915/1917 synthase